MGQNQAGTFAYCYDTKFGRFFSIVMVGVAKSHTLEFNDTIRILKPIKIPGYIIQSLDIAFEISYQYQRNAELGFVFASL